MNSIAFIGAGRMASAIVEGLLAHRVASPSQISATDGGDATAARLAEKTGIRACSSAAEFPPETDLLILACKPQQLETLDPVLANQATGRLVLSILAGTRLATLADKFPGARNVVRVMPNTPAQIGAGISAWCARQAPPDEDRQRIEAVLGAMGSFLELPEEQFDAVTALSGSGPAYLFEFIAALREAGREAGLPAEISTRLALHTVLGAARLLLETGEDPETLRDNVTSPGGTTQAGLQVMEEGGFRQILRDTVLAAQKRSIELSQPGPSQGTPSNQK